MSNLNFNTGAQRDEKGRFVPKNTIAFAGWSGLVTKRFNGDSMAAKTYMAQLGRWAYSRQAIATNSPLTMQIRSETCFKHPGAIEDFVLRWNLAMDFQLADVAEMPF